MTSSDDAVDTAVGNDAARQWLRGQRVLIVDDDPTQSALLTRRLARAGLDTGRIELVTSGFEALVAASDRQFRLMFVDRNMPGLNGIDTVLRLRAITASTPIVGFTSDCSREVRAAFLAAGADDCLPKPISQRLLDAVMLRWLVEEPLT